MTDLSASTGVQVWTDDRVGRLRALWAEGLSARAVANEIGGISRSAVIGKAYRLGLASRKSGGTGKQPKPKPKKIDKQTKKSFPVGGGSDIWVTTKLAALPKPEPYTDPPALETPSATMETLESGMCRWPIGDPKQPGFGFCGCKQVVGLPYCAPHARRAYQPPQGRKPATYTPTVRRRAYA